jgi:hypothetical protein
MLATEIKALVTFLVPDLTTVNMQCSAEKMRVFCRLQWALKSGSIGLIYASHERLKTVCYKIFSCFERVLQEILMYSFLRTCFMLAMSDVS